MRGRSIHFALVVLAGAAVYLAVLNRQLTIRQARTEAELERIRAVEAASEVGKEQTRGIPWRRLPLPGGAARESAPEPLLKTSSTQDSVASEPAEQGDSPTADAPPLSERIAGEVVAMREVVVPIVVPGADWTRYFAREGSRCTVDGTSNIHDWGMETKVIAGQVGMRPGLDGQNTSAMGQYATNLPCSATAVIPVRSLETRDTVFKTLLLKAIDVERYPTVNYQLRQLVFDYAVTNPTPVVICRSMGELTIHGVTNQVEIPATIELRDQQANLIVTGRASLKLSDFGIKPPESTLAMGLLKMGDELRITFEWHLQRRSPP